MIAPHQRHDTGRSILEAEAIGVKLVRNETPAVSARKISGKPVMISSIGYAWRGTRWMDFGDDVDEIGVYRVED
jgi:hypothetical protein